MISFDRSAKTYIAPAQSADADALSDIHEQCFTARWTAEDIAALLRSRGARGLVLYRRPLFGPPKPTGFILVRMAADEAEILTLAVDPHQRGRGYGRLLVEEAIRQASREEIASLFLEVDEANVAAVNLYRSLRFTEVGRRAGYYRDTDGQTADALVMRASLR